jgi:hypothetical protein
MNNTETNEITELRSIINAIKKGDVYLFKKRLSKGFFKNKNHQKTILSFSFENKSTDIIKIILKDERFSDAFLNNYPLFAACRYNHIEILEYLINEKKVDVSYDSNEAIYNSFQRDNMKIVFRLWEEKIVKETLLNEHPELYHFLKTQDLKKNIRTF